MSALISFTEDDTLSALRGFLLAVLPAGVEVIAAQSNRVPVPTVADFVTMTPILRKRLGTNVAAYIDKFPDGESIKASVQSTEFTVQLDVHGPSSGDHSQIIATMFRDDFASVQFFAFGLAIAPLYASDPRQMPFTNGEMQTEMRWNIDVAIQVKPAVGIDQAFAGALSIGVINAEVRPLPNPA